MRTRLIEELNIVVDHPPDVLLAENQNMVQTVAPDRANEPFAERVRFGGIQRRVDEFDPETCDRMVKLQPVFVIVIADEEARLYPKRSGFAHLLGNPGIGGRAGHADMYHPSGAVLDDEEQEYSAKKQVKGLDVVTCPNLAAMVGQEGRPALAMMLWWQLASGLPHIVADSTLVDPKAQLQQLTPNTLGSPAPVVDRHLLDERDRLRRNARLTGLPFRFR